MNGRHEERTLRPPTILRAQKDLLENDEYNYRFIRWRSISFQHTKKPPHLFTNINYRIYFMSCRSLKLTPCIRLVRHSFRSYRLVAFSISSYLAHIFRQWRRRRCADFHHCRYWLITYSSRRFPQNANENFGMSRRGPKRTVYFGSNVYKAHIDSIHMNSHTRAHTWFLFDMEDDENVEEV